MKVRLVQKDCNNPELKPFLDAAAQADVDLICFPELATSGCLYTPRDVEPLQQWLELFGQYNMRIICGMPLIEDGVYRNTLVYYHNGKMQKYRKVNLFEPMNEHNVYAPGSTPGMFETDFGKVGAAICYDVRFPELFADIKAAGAERLIVCAAFPLVRIDAWRRLVIERAQETGLPTIGVNAVGDDGENVFGGTTMVVGPDGTVVHEADNHSEMTLEFELAVNPSTRA